MPQESIVRAVLDCYPLEVSDVSLIQRRTRRTFWTVATDQGEMILRQTRVDSPRMLFIAAAQLYLEQRGLAISRLHLTKEGGACVSVAPHSYVLFERLKGQPLNYFDREHLKQAMQFMAGFHVASEGYSAPNESKSRRRVGKWHRLYRWRIQELEGYRLLAANHPDDPFSAAFKEHADFMIDNANQALTAINGPGYEDWTNECAERGTFCQQDFTLARLVSRADFASMRELRSINKDLPARDMRIFINKVMKKLSVWDSNLAADMLHWYQEANALDEPKWRILWADLQFPHLFYSTVHKYYLNLRPIWSLEKHLQALKNVISVEQTKTDFINHFDETYAYINGALPMDQNAFKDVQQPQVTITVVRPEKPESLGLESAKPEMEGAKDIDPGGSDQIDSVDLTGFRFETPAPEKGPAGSERQRPISRKRRRRQEKRTRGRRKGR